MISWRDLKFGNITEFNSLSHSADVCGYLRPFNPSDGSCPHATVCEKFCALDEDCLKLLERAMTAQKLSARAYDRILKVSRTISDLAGEETIGPAAISEAINYRTPDREM